MLTFIRSLFLLGIYLGNCHAAITEQEFSAEAVIIIPGQPMTKSMLYVSNTAVRTETKTKYGVSIDIARPYKGLSYKLNPEFKQYIQYTTTKDAPSKSTNPCVSLPLSTCELVGEELIDGNRTQKWQVISVQSGKNIRTMHWIDVKRKLAIREFFQDGSLAEMKLQKQEVINTRNTEKWLRTVSRPDGSAVSSLQWYDP